MTINTSGTWQWSRTDETRKVLLNAARDVFIEQGYLTVSVADIVKKANSSTGSLYHHFGGKADIFLALWNQHESAHAEHVSAAVNSARAAESSPLDIFCAGARAYLEGTWKRRDVARMFIDVDGPPGFGSRRRAGRRRWIDQNIALLGFGNNRSDRVLVSVLTAVIAEAGSEMTNCKTKRQANEVWVVAERIIRRLADDPPVKSL